MSGTEIQIAWYFLADKVTDTDVREKIQLQIFPSCNGLYNQMCCQILNISSLSKSTSPQEVGEYSKIWIFKNFFGTKINFSIGKKRFGSNTDTDIRSWF